MTKIKNFLNSFITGWQYPLFVAFFVLFGHTFSLEILSFFIIVISAVIGLFITNSDLRFMISPVLMIVFTVSEKSSNLGAGKLFQSSSLFLIFFIAFIFATALITYLIINRKRLRTKNILSSKMFFAFLVIALGIAFNGLFFKESFGLTNLLYSLAVIASLLGIYLVFHLTIDFDDSFKKYLIFVLFIASMVVTLEFYSLFLNGQIKFADGKIIKESVVTGWAIWNNMGCMMTMLLPIHFYLAAFVKKYGFIFYFTGGISYLAVVLSLSRSSLLVSSFLLLICVIYTCFCGNNKLINRIITLCALAFGIVGIIILWDKIALMLNDYLVRGLSDNGRFEIYLSGLKTFLDYPIFGTGFFSYATHQSGWLPFGYHNTIIQMLASCGIVGFAAYGYHRIITIKLCWQKRSVINLPLYLCVAGLLLTSLLDVHFFNIYPAFYYSLILLTIEKTTK